MRKSLLVGPIFASLLGCASEPPVHLPPAHLWKGEQPLNVHDHYRIHDRPYGAPDYQAPFRNASHRAPTEASRRAAERQFRELAGLIVGRTTGPDKLRGYLDLPDGRFSDFVPQERGAILAVEVPVDPDFAIVRCDVYAAAMFRDASRRRIANPKREIWYALGDGRLRKIHPSQVRYLRQGESIRQRLPGQKGYATARFRTPGEAWGMEDNPVPDRWSPYPGRV